MDLEFREVDHTYTLNGAVVPHVTGVTDALAVYAGVPRDVLQAKAELGSAVHYATELDDDGDLDNSSVPDEIRGYVDAWRRFRTETVFEVVANEHRVYSDTYRYAGTLDRIGYFHRMKGVRKDTRVLIDLKTTYKLMPAVGPQTSGYQWAWNEQHPDQKVARRFAVRLKPGGTYELHECADLYDWSVFLSALSLLAWKQRHNLGDQI